MRMHKVIIAQDKGNIVMRAYHYINPLKFTHIGVTVKNLITQSAWDYDAYHEEFPEGKYVLIFVGEDGSKKGTMELDITPSTPDVVCVVYKWSESIQYLSTKQVSIDEFKEMSNKNRLMNPYGYRGY